MTVPLGLALCLLLPTIQAAPGRAPLAAREDWRETPAATPITQAHGGSAELQLMVMGPGAAEIKKSHHDQPADG